MKATNRMIAVAMMNPVLFISGLGFFGLWLNLQQWIAGLCVVFCGGGCLCLADIGEKFEFDPPVGFAPLFSVVISNRNRFAIAAGCQVTRQDAAR